MQQLLLRAVVFLYVIVNCRVRVRRRRHRIRRSRHRQKVPPRGVKIEIQLNASLHARAAAFLQSAVSFFNRTRGGRTAGLKGAVVTHSLSEELSASYLNGDLYAELYVGLYN